MTSCFQAGCGFLYSRRRSAIGGFAAILLFSAGLFAAQNSTAAAQSSADQLPSASMPHEVSAADNASGAKEPYSAPLITSEVDLKSGMDASLSGIPDLSLATNNPAGGTMSDQELLAHFVQKLENARYLRATRQPREAEPLLMELMGGTAPEPIKQSALLELAAIAQDDNDVTRAQQIYSQFINRWTGDPRIPEILLRQGLIFRRMGLNNLAFAKFYAVMTSALVLKNDKLEYYSRLVLQAQMEIAETHYELGKYTDAADFFSRLLKQNNPAINKPEVLYKLVRCHAALGRNSEAVAEAQDFLLRYPAAPEQPEIRFHLAQSLKQLDRNNESLQQVLLLLQEQRIRTKGRPEVWAYWQQRTGNIIANQLYREGDYLQALEIYQNLIQLDPSPQWQLPVQYQIGMTYERLWQPEKAMDTYAGILDHEKDLGPEIAPSLKTVMEMARWRISFIQWQNKAETVNRRLRDENPSAANLPLSKSSP